MTRPLLWGPASRSPVTAAELAPADADEWEDIG
jgi:hypothetical protein